MKGLLAYRCHRSGNGHRVDATAAFKCIVANSCHSVGFTTVGNTGRDTYRATKVSIGGVSQFLVGQRHTRAVIVVVVAQAVHHEVIGACGHRRCNYRYNKEK